MIGTFKETIVTAFFSTFALLFAPRARSPESFVLDMDVDRARGDDRIHRARRARVDLP
jgi:hypothetical protein